MWVTKSGQAANDVGLLTFLAFRSVGNGISIGNRRERVRQKKTRKQGKVFGKIDGTGVKSAAGEAERGGVGTEGAGRRRSWLCETDLSAHRTPPTPTRIRLTGG